MRVRVATGVGLAVLVTAVVGAVVLSILGVLALRSRDRALEAQLDQLVAAREAMTALEADNSRLTDEVADLVAEVEALQERIDDSYAPVEIGGPVDFPVQRGMARSGDSLSGFAEREGTSPAVVRALNPWLPDGDPTLQDRQTLWIPKPAEE